MFEFDPEFFFSSVRTRREGITTPTELAALLVSFPQNVLFSPFSGPWSVVSVPWCSRACLIELVGAFELDSGAPWSLCILFARQCIQE